MNTEILSKKLSIGHNGTSEFEKVLEKYHMYINQVFFAPPNTVIQSTRPNDRTFNGNYTDIIRNHMIYVKENKYNIKFQLLLNAQCWGNEFRSLELIKKVIDFCKELGQQIDDISVSDPFLARELKKEFPNTSYTLSVISAINDVETAVEIIRLFPEIDTICVGHKMTYDIEGIKKIKEQTKRKIKLLVNQGCYFNCPDYTLHSVALAHTQVQENMILGGEKLYCDCINSDETLEGWKNLTHQALAPQFINFYETDVDIFKLSTRIEKDVNRISNIIDAYVNCNKDYYHKKLFMGGGRSVSYRNAAIFSLVEYPEGYIEFRNQCKNQCSNCNYCKKIWRAAEHRFESTPETLRPTKESLQFRDNSPKLPIYTEK